MQGQLPMAHTTTQAPRVPACFFFLILDIIYSTENIECGIPTAVETITTMKTNMQIKIKQEKMLKVYEMKI